MKHTSTILGTAFLLTACGLSPTAQWQAAQLDAATQVSAGCDRAIDDYLAQQCSDQAKSTIGSTGRQGYADGISRSAQVLKQQCASASPDKLAKIDACLSELNASIATEAAARAERLPVERPKVAEVKSDPKYTALREAYDRVARDASKARREADLARKDHLASAYDRDQIALRLERDRRAALEPLRDLVASHGVDPRDGTDLDLW